MGNTLKINLQPDTCNLCSGEVVYVSNAAIYGKEYGSGFCYLCKNCGAYVGTHRGRPKEAFGILANRRMRDYKKTCHGLFDRLWNTKEERRAMYKKLAEAMEIPVEECHFGYFDTHQLIQALSIIMEWTRDD